MAHSGEWELSKENVQPLRYGRKVENLSAALQPTADLNQSNIFQRQAYETELRAYKGDDPLDPWYRYIKWTEQTFPKGGKGSNLAKLLQRCAGTFRGEARYLNDPRFVDVWLQLAHMAVQSLDMFELMRDQGVGSTCSRFYEEWAWELEQLGSTNKADAVYTEGLAKNAQPRDRLEQQHREFQSRVGRMLMTQMQETGSNPPTIHDGQRSTLGELRGRGKHQKVGTHRVGSAKTDSKGGLGLAVPLSANNGRSAIRVFDENSDDVSALGAAAPAGTKQYKTIPDQDVAHKENTMKPGKWTDHRIPQRNVPAASVGDAGMNSKPTFTIHEDEGARDVQATPLRKAAETNSQVLSARKPDPTWHTLPFIQEEPKPNTKAMYCKHLVYGGVSEMSFEELWAIKYYEDIERKRIEDEKTKIAKQQEDLRQQQEKFQMQVQQLRMEREAFLQQQHHQQHENEQQGPDEEHHHRQVQHRQPHHQQPHHQQSQHQQSQHHQQQLIEEHPHVPMREDSDTSVSCTRQLVFNDSNNSESFHQKLNSSASSTSFSIPLGNPLQHIPAPKSGTPSNTSITPNCSLPSTSGNASQLKTPGSASNTTSADSSLRSIGKNKKQLLTRLPGPRTPGGLTEPSPTIHTKAALDVMMDALNESLSDFRLGATNSFFPEDQEFECQFLKKDPTPSNSFAHAEGTSTFSSISRPTQISKATPVLASQPIKIFEDPNLAPPVSTKLSQPKMDQWNGMIFMDEREDAEMQHKAENLKKSHGLVLQEKDDVDMMDAEGYDGKEDEDCKENIAPSSYLQPAGPRRKLGLLQPSEGIPVDPDSAPERSRCQDHHEPEEEEMDGVQPSQEAPSNTNTTRFHDSTIFHTTNVSFSGTSRLASTPFSNGGNLSFTPTCIIKPSYSLSTEESFTAGKSSGDALVKGGNVFQEKGEGALAKKCPARILSIENETLDKTEYTELDQKPLSPIIETSAEDARSSASSSSSSQSQINGTGRSQHLSQTQEGRKTDGEPGSTNFNVTLRRGRSHASVSDLSDVQEGLECDHSISNKLPKVKHSPAAKSERPLLSLGDELMEASENLVANVQDLSMHDVDDCNVETGKDDEIDPFDEALKMKLLCMLPESFKEYPGYMEMDADLPVFQDGTAIDMGDSEKIVWIEGMIGEGAFAKVYFASILEEDDFEDMSSHHMRVAFKVQRPPNPWEFYITRALHSRMEALAIPEHVRSSVMSAGYMYVFRDASCLVTDYHPRGTLLNFVNRIFQKTSKRLDERMIGMLALNIVELVHAMHQCQVIHGDIKPDNFLIANLDSVDKDSSDPKSFLKLIDMGRSIDMRVFPEGTTFTAKCNTSGFTCTEMQEGKPWTYQTDYFGLAGTIHVMMFGTYMKVYQEKGIWKTTSNFQRVLQFNWKGLFHKLLNIPSCHPKDLPSLSEITQELRDFCLPDSTLTESIICQIYMFT